jgi:methionine synthase I (cobalamin-dependent)
MTKELLHEVAKSTRLVGDGAVGTQLMLAGLEQGDCGEAWNLSHPERVLAIQRRYMEAGVAIAGSCCGSTPEHTRAIRRKVDEFLAAR